MACLKKIAFCAFLMAFLMADVLLAINPKRGLAANDDVEIKDFGGNNSQVVWQYNWDSNTSNKQPFLEYVPMLWTVPENPGVWKRHATAWIDSGTRHLLAFNEPENAGQSNIDPATAASAYRKYMQPFAGQVKLGAPAVSNDGYTWMSQFLDKCDNCSVDFVPIHWYNPVFLLDDFKNFTLEMCDLVGDRPIWVTEFMPLSDNTTAVANFVKDAIAWLDQEDCVERYAYFGTADGFTSLLHDSGPGLSALGQAYAYGPYGGGGGHLDTDGHVGHAQVQLVRHGYCVVDVNSHVVYREDLAARPGQDQGESRHTGPCIMEYPAPPVVEKRAGPGGDCDVHGDMDCAGPCDPDQRNPPSD